MEFISDSRIKVDPPKRPKKLTATRFAAIMNLNKWSSPFAAWCEMTRTYEEPFKETIYTNAGKVIEPKLCEYLRKRYFMDIKTPTDVYGPDYFKRTYGDFFPQNEALGGMWDFLGDDFVVEAKTTKRVEDWRGPDGSVEPPVYYKLQASLYAYLLGFDDVVMICGFLEDKDYEDPDAWEPNVNNTVVVEFKVSEEYPTFKESYVDKAIKFWNDYVLTGISPEFDEKRDAEILKVLRKNTTEASSEEIANLMLEADRLRVTIERSESKLKEKKDRLKEIEDLVKKSMIKQFRDGDKKVEVASKKFNWILTKVVSSRVDTAALKKDLPDVAKKYTKEAVSYRLDTETKE